MRDLPVAVVIVSFDGAYGGDNENDFDIAISGLVDDFGFRLHTIAVNDTSTVAVDEVNVADGDGNENDLDIAVNGFVDDVCVFILKIYFLFLNTIYLFTLFYFFDAVNGCC